MCGWGAVRTWSVLLGWKPIMEPPFSPYSHPALSPVSPHIFLPLSCPHYILLLNTRLQKTQIQKLFSPYSHPALSPTPSLLLFQSRAVVCAFNAKLLFPFSKPTIHPYTKQVNYARSHCFVLILNPPSCQFPPSCPH